MYYYTTTTRNENNKQSNKMSTITNHHHKISINDITNKLNVSNTITTKNNYLNTNNTCTISITIFILFFLILSIFILYYYNSFFFYHLNTQNNNLNNILQNKDYIWIDSDVGMDDIFAIQLLLYFENTKYEISHISSIYGMTHNVMEGAFYLQSLLNYNNNNLLKVYNGINKPLQNQKEFHTFMEANWYTNIENNQNLFFKKEMNWNKIDNHPVDNTIPLMERKFKMENKLISFKNIPNNSITILALGPLTNIANYINIYGIDFTKKIKKIISMGGNAIFKKEITNQEIINRMDNNGKINFGNNTKIEWNYFCDPKSIKIVTKTFLNNFYLIGFDVIYENLITKDKLNILLNILLQNNKNDLNNLQKINYKLLSINNDAYLYDPITSSYFIDKNLFLFEKVKIKINLESKSLENFASKIEICKSNEKDDYCEEEIEINVAKHLKVNEYYRLLERYFRMIGNNIAK